MQQRIGFTEGGVMGRVYWTHKETAANVQEDRKRKLTHRT